MRTSERGKKCEFEVCSRKQVEKCADRVHRQKGEAKKVRKQKGKAKKSMNKRSKEQSDEVESRGKVAIAIAREC